jgi:hypothetical protein
MTIGAKGAFPYETFSGAIAEARELTLMQATIENRNNWHCLTLSGSDNQRETAL